MLKLMIAIILIYICPVAMAGGDREAMHEITTISELLPDAEDLDRQPRCEGNAHTANSCSRFVTLNTCLDAGADQGCFWAYY